jgi:serine/threonine protein kinase
MEQRITYYENTFKSFPKRQNSCITPRGLLKKIQFTHRIGSGLFGNVYAAKLREKPFNIYRNIRTLPRFHKKLKTKPQFVVKLAFRSDPHILESKLCNIVSDIVYYKKCPHFPLSYGYFTCNNVNFANKGVFKEPGDWERVKQGKGIIHFSEFTGIGYQSFLDLNPSASEIRASIAQILIAVYTLQKHNLCHNDLYFTNITMKTIDKPSVFKYTVNKRKYNIAVKRFIPVIIDFGQSSQVSKFNKESGDLFHFLTDFSVSNDGSRPYIVDNTPVITQRVPLSARKTIQNMLLKLVTSQQPDDGNAPFSSHLSKKYMTGDKLLKETFRDMITKDRITETSHRFTI